MTQRLLPCLALALSLIPSSPAFAQSTPTAASPPKSTTPVPTLRASSRLVVVDVVVEDNKGNPIHNLKPTDFTLLESGQPQTIGHFEEHAANASSATPMPPLPKLEPGTFTNYTPAPPNGAVNVLLLDALNTPMQDQAFVRDQMLKYLKTPHPGVRMAIFGLNKQLHMLQGFTSDPDTLRNAIAGKKNLPKGSALLDDPVSGNTYGKNTLSEDAEIAFGNAPGAAAIVASMAQFEAQNAAFQTSLRTQYTLDAMNSLARYLAGIPGRKNLIWFSGSFPLSILPNADITDPFAVVANMQDEYRETVNLLARGQVSVYPIDARGLVPPPMFNAVNDGQKYARNPSAMGRDGSKFSADTAAEQSTMRQMAQDTGGKAFVNTNGLAEAVTKAVEAGSNFYTLTYIPSKTDWKGDYRRIQVKLNGQNYQLSYRRGYYADDPDAHATKGPAKVAATAPTTPYDPMRLAMTFGGPQPTQIVFSAIVRPTTGDVEPEPLKTTSLNPKIPGPYRRFSVIFTASPRFVAAAPAPDGTRHVELEYITFTYDDQGVLVASTGNRVKSDLSPERYQAMLKGGIQYQQQISIPIKGNYFLRVGLRDIPSGHVGAIELPLDAVKRLKSIQAEAAAEAKP
jgi:VWFA-related protein